jgi:hypothetical protein
VGEVAQASEGEPPRLWGHLEAGEELQLTGGIPRLIRVEIFGVHPIESLGGQHDRACNCKGIPAILRGVFPQMNISGD